MKNEQLKSFDMFSGYGGFAIAGERCGIKTIGFSEIDKYASAVLKYRFPEVVNYGDCTRIDWRSVPDFDLLNGGSPCQSFSIAGKRKGLAGASGLVWEYLRCLGEKQPRYFIWENVKGALSSRRGLDFANILAAFSEQGYDLWWQVLNAKDFGVPQNRERVFVIGVRNGSPREVFFEREDYQEVVTANALDACYSKGDNRPGNKSGCALIEQLNHPTHSNNRIYGDKGLSPALNTAQGGNWKPKIARTALKTLTRNQKEVEGDYAFCVDGANTGGIIVHNMQPRSPDSPSLKTSSGGSGHLTRTDGITYTVDTGNTNAVEVYDDYNSKFRTDGLVGSITTNIGNQAPRNGTKLKIAPCVRAEHHNTADVHFIGSSTRIRRLTPRECERLMGLEDDWLKWGINDKGEKIEISDSQRYKMAGNGVVVNVVEFLMCEMIKYPLTNSR